MMLTEIFFTDVFSSQLTTACCFAARIYSTQATLLATTTATTMMLAIQHSRCLLHLRSRPRACVASQAWCWLTAGSVGGEGGAGLFFLIRFYIILFVNFDRACGIASAKISIWMLESYQANSTFASLGSNLVERQLFLCYF